MGSLVVIRFGALGDTLMLTPVFRYLAGHSGAPVDFVGKAPFSSPMLSANPDVGEVAEIRSKRVPYWFNEDQSRLVHWLGERRDGFFLDLEGDATSAQLLHRAGIPGDRILKLTGITADKRYRHQVENLLARVRTCIEGRGDIDELDISLALPVPGHWHTDTEAWLSARGWRDDELVVIAPGNRRTMSWRPYWRKSNRKHWAPEDWGALCDRMLADRPQARVLVVGAPVEQRLAQRVVREARSDRVHAVAEETILPRLIALMARAHSAVTLDSGPAHIAAAVDCPVVTLYRATDPARFRPLAHSGAVRVVTPGAVPIEQWQAGPISVAHVHEAWRQLQELPGFKTARPGSGAVAATG